ncbi:MAG: hypothetical protein JJT76_00705 [Clostridiaceae bacterium]|nr:hypothetical protein [Clostridiaceae bacterium]
MKPARNSKQHERVENPLELDDEINFDGFGRCKIVVSHLVTRRWDEKNAEGKVCIEVEKDRPK